MDANLVQQPRCRSLAEYGGLAVPSNVAEAAQLATEQCGSSGERLMMFVLERTASAVSWSETISEDRDTRRTIGSTSQRRPLGISRLSSDRLKFDI